MKQFMEIVRENKRLREEAETALENVKTKDLGEVGELLGNVVKELKNFDEEEEKRIFRNLQKAGK